MRNLLFLRKGEIKDQRLDGPFKSRYSIILETTIGFAKVLSFVASNIFVFSHMHTHNVDQKKSLSPHGQIAPISSSSQAKTQPPIQSIFN